MFRRVTLATTVLLVGCGSIIGEDFEGYSEVEDVAPLGCDPAHPYDDSARFFSCFSDETCELATGDTARGWGSCVPIVGRKSLGAYCSYANECGPGAFCSDTGCALYCHVGNSCADGSACKSFRRSVAANGIQIGFCPPPSCEPVTSKCSGTCSFYEADQTACFTTTGTGAIGASCKSDTDCVAHLGCDDVAKHCTHYCRVGGADCAGKECVATNKPALYYAGTRYGYCAL